MMQKILFTFMLLCGNFAFSQTLTPEICWSFDGKNTDVKEVVLIPLSGDLTEFTKQIAHEFKIKQTTKIGLAEINHAIALIDDDVRWIVMPNKWTNVLSENYSEQPRKISRKEQKEMGSMLISELLFLLSLHDLELKTPINNATEVLLIDKNIIKLLHSIRGDDYYYGSSDIPKEFIRGYTQISMPPYKSYPTAAERIGTMFIYQAMLADSMQQIRDEEYAKEMETQAIQDSIENVVEIPRPENSEKIDQIVNADRSESEIDSILKAHYIRLAEDSLAMANMYVKNPKTKVKCTTPKRHLGKAKEGERLIHTFLVKNVGKEDLYFFDAITDSKAVGADYCAFTGIKPGESCRVIVFWTPDASDIGKAARRVRLKGNFEPALTLTLKAKVSRDESLYNISQAEADYHKSIYTVPIDEAQALADSLPKTAVKWEEDTYNFKEVVEGEKVTHHYKLQNIGKEDLHITKVKPSCGCTASYCDKEIIKPGETCEVIVEFNSAGKSGTQQKSITVTGNFEGGTQKVLKITGDVIEKKNK